MLSDTKGTMMNTYVKDYVIFDLETTGISCYNDEVIEISAIKVKNEKVVEEFSSLVNPRRPIPFMASSVNGITDDMVKDAPFFEDVLEEFLSFIEDLPLVGHNIHSFDMKFMHRDCEKFFGKVIGNDYADTLKLARVCLPQLKHHKLVDLAEYYGISSKGAHRALNDCRMNQMVYEKLGKELKSPKAEAKGLKACPRCGSPLKKRSGRYGEFMGCTSYPDCRYTENV